MEEDKGLGQQDPVILDLRHLRSVCVFVSLLGNCLAAFISFLRFMTSTN